jgi:hypothetical protein
MKNVIIEGLFAVGMHHHGLRALEVGAQSLNQTINLTKMLSPDIHILMLFLSAYLSSEDARLISDFCRNGMVEGPILIKPKFESVCRARVGPPQRCNVRFFTKNKHVKDIEKISNELAIYIRFLDC